jgi:hypothetical protein
MKDKRPFSKTAVACFAVAVLVIGMLLIQSPHARAEKADNGNDDQSKIQQGFAIAPVPLNFAGKNHALVGLGSYIVNAVGDCNGCHSAGPPTEYAAGGNPYFLPGTTPPLFGGVRKVNTATYLGGGRDFGQLGNPAAGMHIVSRNLTPDHTGRAIGGDTLAEFVNTMRTGQDPDALHPFTCSIGGPGNCVPFPFNPAKLQIMRWPNFHDMTDRDLSAIYEYLSAIPCIPGPSDTNNPFYGVLHHDC